jgi:hypothetical protein
MGEGKAETQFSTKHFKIRIHFFFKKYFLLELQQDICKLQEKHPAYGLINNMDTKAKCCYLNKIYL